MSKVVYAVSFYDVNHILKQADKCVDMLTEKEIEEILFSIGMCKKGVEVEEVLHRPKYSPNNEPWFGKRFTGFERQDKEWMYGGKATLDNVISSQDDLEHKKDLLMMSRQANHTQIAIESKQAEQESKRKKQ